LHGYCQSVTFVTNKTTVEQIMNKLTFILLFVFSLFPFSAYSQEDNYRFQANFYGGLYLNNEQAWTLEPSVAWHFHKYMGLSLGIEFTSQYNQPSRHITINGQLAELADNEKNIAWIIFKPTIILKSPDIWKNDDKGYRIWVQAEPGISLACPSRNSLTYEIFHGNATTAVDYQQFRFPNKNLKWFYWNVRLSVNMAIDRFVLGAGYAISDLDYYSGRRNVTLADGKKFYVPGKELSQNIFLSIGYKF